MEWVIWDKLHGKELARVEAENRVPIEETWNLCPARSAYGCVQEVDPQVKFCQFYTHETFTCQRYEVIRADYFKELTEQGRLKRIDSDSSLAPGWEQYQCRGCGGIASALQDSLCGRYQVCETCARKKALGDSNMLPPGQVWLREGSPGSGRFA